ncbi:MAG: hypothetical protein IKU36_02065 [Bacteroidales bacterium]|nr:hypothetical protein [Bacteroidales bacterium]
MKFVKTITRSISEEKLNAILEEASKVYDAAKVLFLPEDRFDGKPSIIEKDEALRCLRRDLLDGKTRSLDGFVTWCGFKTYLDPEHDERAWELEIITEEKEEVVLE